MLHIPQTSLLLLAAKLGPISYRKILKNYLENVQKNGPAGRKKIRQKEYRTRQKNKTGDSKVESNDSPEIPDRGETSDIPGLPSGAVMGSGALWSSKEEYKPWE